VGENNCQERLEYANREWNKLKRRLEQCESALERAEKKILELALASREYAACRSSLEDAQEALAQLEKERDELLGLKRKVAHPDFWTEDVSYPLAAALAETSDVLLAKTPTGRVRRMKDPMRIVRSWAYKLYKLVSPELSESDRKEAEIYLIALWYWIRLEEIVARFEVEE